MKITNCPQSYGPLIFLMSENRLVSVGVKLFNPTDWEDVFFWGCFLWKVLRRKIIQLVIARSKLCFFQIARWVDGLGAN